MISDVLVNVSMYVYIIVCDVVCTDAGVSSFLLSYKDCVLKLLPELKTVINLRQHLLAPDSPSSSDQCEGEGLSLTSEEKQTNAGT